MAEKSLIKRFNTTINHCESDRCFSQEKIGLKQVDFPKGLLQNKTCTFKKRCDACNTDAPSSYCETVWVESDLHLDEERIRSEAAKLA
jgi:hypothetical protein